MTGQDIVKKMKQLNLPEGSYVVFGSCPLALAGLRPAQDIDLLVSPKLFAELGKQGWQPHEKAPDDIPLTKDDIDAHTNWDFAAYQPTLKQLLATATMVDGIPFASLEEVRKWKASSGRPKDLVDIKLIDDHLSMLARRSK